MTPLQAAAQAVLDRWDSPAWEWHKQGPTAELMAALRAALQQEHDAESQVRAYVASAVAAERERCAKLLTQSASLAWSEGVAAERERLGASLERLADALEARLGTNAAEWAEVQQARALLGRA